MSESNPSRSMNSGRRRWLQAALGSAAALAGCTPRVSRTEARAGSMPGENQLDATEPRPTLGYPVTNSSASRTGATSGRLTESYETQLGSSWVESHVTWPELQLVNQASKQLNVYRDLIAQRQVVINFFYTRCTGNCPVTMGRMIKLARSLSATQRQKTTFISVSLDGARERPADLESYARSVLPEDVHWELLCGPQSTVDHLRRYLGFYELNETADAIPKSHASMVLFGNDQSHRWIALPAVSTFRQWRSVLARVSA